MSTDEGVRLGTPDRTVQGEHGVASLLKLRGGAALMPEDPDGRDDFFARLLPDFDQAWNEAAQGLELDENERASLLLLRKGAEHAAERTRLLHEASSPALRFFSVPVHIEMQEDVPESQVDVALAWAAKGAPDAISSLSMVGLSQASMAAFFRYQDLTTVPLTAVHAALLDAVPSGNCVLGLRRMPFRARPAAARCSPVYLRFVVGVALTQSACDVAIDRSRWRTFEAVVQAVLSARLQMPAVVKAERHGDLFEAAHRGMREYQAARLDRIVKSLAGHRGVSALLDAGSADKLRRVRLTLVRGRSTLTACMLQVPLDERPAEMLRRIGNALRSLGLTDIVVPAGPSGDGSSFTILAVPV